MEKRKKMDSQNAHMQQALSQQPENKKIKITFEEYQKIAFMVVQVIREFRADGEDSVSQAQVVNKLIHELEI